MPRGRHGHRGPAEEDKLILGGALMPTQGERFRGSALEGVIDVDQANVDRLHKNAIGLPGVLYFCIAGSAPIAAMLFNVPPMATQAGAATPLVFLLSGLGLLLLGISIVYLA